MNRGYIKLWRSSVDNPLYFSQPFTKWQAWVDLLLLANHKENVACVRGVHVTVKRGQVLAADGFLATRWKWSRNKVRRYLSQIGSKTIQQIEHQANNVCSLISITNWESYQGNGTANDTASDTAERQQKVQQKDTPKNVKNDKNDKEEESAHVSAVEKKAYGEFKNVMLSDDERGKLIAENGIQVTESAVEELSAYIARTGRKYKSHYACMNKGAWVWEKAKKSAVNDPFLFMRGQK